MASDRDKSPPTIEVLTVGEASVSNGILSFPLRVNVHGAAASEGDIVLVLTAPVGEELSAKLQARVPQAVRQWNGTR